MKYTRDQLNIQRHRTTRHGAADTLEATEADEPNIRTLQSELEDARNGVSDFARRVDWNQDVRYCRWAGQSEDGRKWQENMDDREVFPWDGASDTRVMLADVIIMERTMVKKAAFFGSKLQAVGTESGDLRWSRDATTLLKWMLFTHMLQEINAEVEHVAQWEDECGLAVMAIHWETRTRMELREVSIEALLQLAQQTESEEMLQFIEALHDPLREEEAIDAIETIAAQLAESSGNASLLTRADARRIMRDLRTDGRAEFPMPYVVTSRPRWTALRPYEDVFFSAARGDIQRSRFVAQREWLTTVELDEKVQTEGWDEAFVEALKAHGGKNLADDNEAKRVAEMHWSGGDSRGGASTRTDGLLSDDLRGMHEVFHCYYYASDRGVPALYCTVIAEGLGETYAKHEPMSYAHGEMPFISFVRERAQRNLMESRGVPEVVATWQNEIKTQRDYRSDRASIAIMPPVYVPPNQAGMDIQLFFGPGRRIPKRAGEDMAFMQPPRNDTGSVETEAAVTRDVDYYFGRMTANVPPARQQLVQQDYVNNFLIPIKACVMQTLQLMQQYMSDEEITRVAGGRAQAPQRSRAEIQGKFDLSITFDVKDLDVEFMKQKLQVIAEILLPMDSGGIVDRAAVVRWAFSAFDPNLADEAIRESGAVTQVEIDDEQNALAKIALGIEPPLRDLGVNPQLRLQVLENSIRQSPRLQQLLQGDDTVGKMIEARVQNFKHLVDQEQNKVIGRLGARPVLGQMPAGAAEQG